MNIKQRLQEIEQRGNLRTLHSIRHEGRFVEYQGSKLLNLSGNDYLGISSNQLFYEEFLEELSSLRYPLGSASSRLLTGNYEVYTELEEIIAQRYNREASLLFNSGYHANLGILSALSDKKTLILADKLVHASLIDGLHLCEANYLRFRHNDLTHLRMLLDKHRHDYESFIVVTESIFSMDGDCADLKSLVSIKQEYSNLMLYVDEAHAIGVRGATGLGLSEELECMDQVDMLVGTFGKAIGSMGAYLVCSHDVKRLLINTMRPLIFSTALPPATIAWSKFVFERLHLLAEQREHLKVLQSSFDSLTGVENSHIIPFIIGSNEQALEAAQLLQKEGFFVLPIRPPTVPPGTSRLRFSLSTAITTEEIQQLILLLNRV